MPGWPGWRRYACNPCRITWRVAEVSGPGARLVNKGFPAPRLRLASIGTVTRVKVNQADVRSWLTGGGSNATAPRAERVIGDCARTGSGADSGVSSHRGGGRR